MSKDEQIKDLEEKVRDLEIQLEHQGRVYDEAYSKLWDARHGLLTDLQMVCRKIQLWGGRPSKQGVKNLVELADKIETVHGISTRHMKDEQQGKLEDRDRALRCMQQILKSNGTMDYEEFQTNLECCGVSEDSLGDES